MRRRLPPCSQESLAAYWHTWITSPRMPKPTTRQTCLVPERRHRRPCLPRGKSGFSVLSSPAAARNPGLVKAKPAELRGTTRSRTASRRQRQQQQHRRRDTATAAVHRQLALGEEVSLLQKVERGEIMVRRRAQPPLPPPPRRGTARPDHPARTEKTRSAAARRMLIASPRRPPVSPASRTTAGLVVASMRPWTAAAVAQRGRRRPRRPR